MKEGLCAYWESLFNDIPQVFYFISMVAIVLTFSLFSVIYNYKRALRYSIIVFFIEYVILIYCKTVIYRPIHTKYTYDYMPFWSYQAYFEGKEPNAIVENLANVLVFIPIGALACIAFKKCSFKFVFSLGLFISVGIESFQLIFRKGFSELDDVIHNTLGCIVGYWMCYMIIVLTRCGFRRFS